MCIAILKPDGETIKKDRLKTCFDNNDDGAGYMFVKNGKLLFVKGFFTFKNFWNSYVKNVVKNGNPISAIHFRITTHGKTNAENCHPFKISDDVGFIHNGIINFVKADKKKSDTSMFNEHILKRLPSDFIRNGAICDLIEESIGTSKLVFLNRKGEYLISNEELGKWRDNVWYSNDSYQWCTTWDTPYVYYRNTPKVPFGTQKKKKKNLPIKVDHSECQLCKVPLLTRYTQNQGFCSACDNADYSG
tara:strand:+ start:724 stop:1461 length:738 start_codon:yes stop_codon:yes gene_type:complete